MAIHPGTRWKLLANMVQEKVSSYTLCVTANLPKEKGRLGGNLMFNDTENTFRPERIHQIAENRGLAAPQEILKKIYVCKIYNSGHLELIIQNQPVK